MTLQTKVRKIGNSFGIILPQEAMHAMRIKEGDVLYMTGGPECSMRITPDHDSFADKAKIAHDIMNRYRNALAELAK